jgi:hypothetical protein
MDNMQIPVKNTYGQIIGYANTQEEYELIFGQWWKESKNVEGTATRKSGDINYEILG